MSKQLYKIKNISETAYRFSSVLKFIPGETVVVSSDDLKAKPVIQLLIDDGKLKIVDDKNNSTEDIEEA